VRSARSDRSAEVLLLVDVGVPAVDALERAVQLAADSGSLLSIVVHSRGRILDHLAPLSGFVTWGDIQSNRDCVARQVARELMAKVPGHVACHASTVRSWRDGSLRSQLACWPDVVVPERCLRLTLRAWIRSRAPRDRFVVVRSTATV
jgi:hypothetical protein